MCPLLCSSMILAVTCAEAQTADSGFLIFPSREAFLRALDLTRPELAPVKAALDAGDVVAASAAYAAHFRTRVPDTPLVPNWDPTSRNPKANTSAADRTLAGHLNDGYSVYEVPPEGLDWHGSPLSCLTRFPILGPIRWAAHNTGDPKYARFIADHILGYMNAYPIGDFVGKSSRMGWTSHTVTAKPWYWCMIPERLAELSDSVMLLRRFPQVTDDELLAMLQRMHEETDYLCTQIQWWVDARHNGGCAMLDALARCALVLGDFAASPRWLDLAARLEAQYIDQAFYPDGMCVELTCAYSMECSMVAERMGFALRDQAAIQAHREKLAEMVTCLVGLSDPTGWLPSFGDLYAGTVDRVIYRPLAEWLSLPWAVALSQRKLDPPPPFLDWPRPAVAVPPSPEGRTRGRGGQGGEDASPQWSGYYTMRSGWSKEALFMALDGGPWGTTHQHGDKLSFVLTAHGAKFVIDPSSTRYASNEPDAFIGGQPSGFLHNTITVDGVDEYHSEGTVAETKEPLHNTWEAGPRHVLFAADYSFAPVKPIRWERRVLFAGREYWLLQDVLSPSPGPSSEGPDYERSAAEQSIRPVVAEGGPDTSARNDTGPRSPAPPEVAVEQNFQFEADISIAFDGATTIATAPNGARLLLIPLEGGLVPQLSIGDKTPHISYWPSGKPSDILRSEDGHDQRHGRGWTGRSGSKLIPAPAVTYVGKLSLPTTITVALIPLAPGQDIAVTSRIERNHRDGETIWTRATSSGPVRFVTSSGRCEVSY